MPRLSTKDSETTKRAPRRQVVRRATSARATAPRTGAEAPATRTRQSGGSEATLERRAPTRVERSERKTFFSKRLVIVALVFIIGAGASFWIGTSDHGQIDVSARITDRNAQIANGTFVAEEGSGESNKIIPVQSGSPTVPNGGLMGRGVGTAPAEQPAVIPDNTTEASTTVTTSEAGTEEKTEEQNPATTDNSTSNN